MTQREQFFKTQMDSQTLKWETEFLTKEAKIDELTSMVDSYKFSDDDLRLGQGATSSELEQLKIKFTRESTKHNVQVTRLTDALKSRDRSIRELNERVQTLNEEVG